MWVFQQPVREAADQKAQIQSVVGKSAQNLKMLLSRMTVEKQEVAQAGKQFERLQELCLAGVGKALASISTPRLKSHIQTMGKNFNGSLLKMGLRQSYEDTFATLKDDLETSEADLTRLYGDLFLKIKAMNTQHGFAIALAPVPKLSTFADKLANTRLSHLHHLDFGNSWRLMSKDHLQRVLQTLFVQVRVIFESAHADIDLWAQATVQVLQTELIERERSLAKRMASVSGVQGSSSDAGAQIAELDAQLEAIKLQGRRLVAISKGIEGEANAVAQQNLGV